MGYCQCSRNLKILCEISSYFAPKIDDIQLISVDIQSKQLTIQKLQNYYVKKKEVYTCKDSAFVDTYVVE